MRSKPGTGALSTDPSNHDAVNNQPSLLGDASTSFSSIATSIDSSSKAFNPSRESAFVRRRPVAVKHGIFGPSSFGGLFAEKKEKKEKEKEKERPLLASYEPNDKMVVLPKRLYSAASNASLKKSARVNTVTYKSRSQRFNKGSRDTAVALVSPSNPDYHGEKAFALLDLLNKYSGKVTIMVPGLLQRHTRDIQLLRHGVAAGELPALADLDDATNIQKGIELARKFIGAPAFVDYMSASLERVKSIQKIYKSPNNRPADSTVNKQGVTIADPAAGGSTVTLEDDILEHAQMCTDFVETLHQYVAQYFKLPLIKNVGEHKSDHPVFGALLDEFSKQGQGNNAAQLLIAACMVEGELWKTAYYEPVKEVLTADIEFVGWESFIAGGKLENLRKLIASHVIVQDKEHKSHSLGLNDNSSGGQITIDKLITGDAENFLERFKTNNPYFANEMFDYDEKETKGHNLEKPFTDRLDALLAVLQHLRNPEFSPNDMQQVCVILDKFSNDLLPQAKEIQQKLKAISADKLKSNRARKSQLEVSIVEAKDEIRKKKARKKSNESRILKDEGLDSDDPQKLTPAKIAGLKLSVSNIDELLPQLHEKIESATKELGQLQFVDALNQFIAVVDERAKELLDNELVKRSSAYLGEEVIMYSELPTAKEIVYANNPPACILAGEALADRHRDCFSGPADKNESWDQAWVALHHKTKGKVPNSSASGADAALFNRMKGTLKQEQSHMQKFLARLAAEEATLTAQQWKQLHALFDNQSKTVEDFNAGLTKLIEQREMKQFEETFEQMKLKMTPEQIACLNERREAPSVTAKQLLKLLDSVCNDIRDASKPISLHQNLGGYSKHMMTPPRKPLYGTTPPRDQSDYLAMLVRQQEQMMKLLESQQQELNSQQQKLKCEKQERLKLQATVERLSRDNSPKKTREEKFSGVSSTGNKAFRELFNGQTDPGGYPPPLALPPSLPSDSQHRVRNIAITENRLCAQAYKLENSKGVPDTSDLQRLARDFQIHLSALDDRRARQERLKSEALDPQAVVLSDDSDDGVGEGIFFFDPEIDQASDPLRLQQRGSHHGGALTHGLFADSCKKQAQELYGEHADHRTALSPVHPF